MNSYVPLLNAIFMACLLIFYIQFTISFSFFSFSSKCVFWTDPPHQFPLLLFRNFLFNFSILAAHFIFFTCNSNTSRCGAAILQCVIAYSFGHFYGLTKWCGNCCDISCQPLIFCRDTILYIQFSAQLYEAS